MSSPATRLAPLNPIAGSSAEIDARHAKAFRTDIQALRGLAVLLVLLHHAGLGLVQAGYLGVDIFFVISGYLITGVVRREILQGTFSFRDFYLRRAKRLLPAAYVVFFALTVSSSYFLSSLELRDYTYQLAGALTFTGNVALWLQTGYFENAAALKPLLHVWSLGIEEQYYLLLPAALVLLPRRFWGIGCLTALTASLLAYLLLCTPKPGATFYLFPTRAWELALGSLGALWVPGQRARSLLALAFWPAVVALVLVPIFVHASGPTPYAAVACLATFIVVLRAHEGWNGLAPARALALVGDFSYSLYLVHWPVFAFAANAYVSEIPPGVRAGLTGLALVLGYSLYRLVEQPARTAQVRLGRHAVVVLIATSLCLIAISVISQLASGQSSELARVRGINYGLSAECEFGEKFTPRPTCMTSTEPRILVWGDSFAKHLLPGMVASTQAGLLQATKSECGPFLGLSRFSMEHPGIEWAKGCVKFNQSVIEHLAGASSVEVVVLASSFTAYAPNPSGHPDNIRQVSDGFELIGATQESSADAMDETIRRIRALGKRVIVVAPPPSAGFDSSKCLERVATGKIVWGSRGIGCDIDSASYRRHQQGVLTLMDRIEERSQVKVLRFDETLCSPSACSTSQQGTFIYRDAGHLSYDGSVVLGRTMRLGERLLKEAR
jgi:peptidoglycan/LPS O-acetylase OafA/YrhL